jgi:ABC-2 type transport system ATP-binding protein
MNIEEPQMETPILTVGLTRSFGTKQVLAGLDLEVGPGEIFGLLGPNGAGKTTTVRILATLLRPTSGHARIAGFDVATEARSVRRVIGAALQETGLDPLMTGAELMALQAALHRMPSRAAAARSAELLAAFGLDAVAGQRVSTYSGGMRRRLDLALSVLHEPPVLFLDEPTAGVDPTSRMAVWDQVRYLSERGIAILLTTHYLDEADRLCQRAAFLSHGRVVRQGPLSDLKAEVDVPKLVITVDAAARERARVVLAAFGGERAAPQDSIAIGLDGGQVMLPQVIRALDDEDLVVQAVRLESPTIDDLFAAVAGRQLEGAAEGEAT